MQTLDSQFSLAGRVALVTGAARGLGREIAELYAAAGAHVLVNSRNPDHCEAVVNTIREAGFNASSLSFDVGDLHAAESALATVERDHGKLDIVVNNVGVRLRVPTETVTAEMFTDHLAVNVSAAYHLSKLAARLMVTQRWGRILMMSSITAERAAVGNVAYITAKGAMNALTRSLAVEYGRDGITCNAIAAGIFLTETNRSALTPEQQALRSQGIAVGRVGQPAEIAGAALFLAAEASRYVSGQVLRVDGGLSIMM